MTREVGGERQREKGMDRQKRIEGNRWKEREAQGLMQSKQENQRGWVQHMPRQKEHMALARAGEE